jgi:hypothetical protein
VGDEVEGALLKMEELLHLDVQREGPVPRHGGGAGHGEVGAVAEVRPQRLQVRAQVAHVQALTCSSLDRSPTRMSYHQGTCQAITPSDSF